MGMRRQIMLLSSMILVVLTFIFVVTSLSRNFYFLAYGNRADKVAALTISADGGENMITAAADEIRDKGVLMQLSAMEKSEETTEETTEIDASESEDRAETVTPASEEAKLQEAADREEVLAKDKESNDEIADTAIETEEISEGAETDGIVTGTEEGTEEAEREVLVLMFHDIIDSEYLPDSTYLSRGTFEAILQRIRKFGYNTVDVGDMLAFVNGEADLPQKSIVLTFDDGYYSNYDVVYPLLQKYNMKALYFPIGVSVGKQFYKDSGMKMIRHYGIPEMLEMQASGLVEFGSHSYDMHQNKVLEESLGNYKPRLTIVKHEDESEEDYINAFYLDMKLNFQVYEGTDIELMSFSCPRGAFDSLSLKLIQDFEFPAVFISQKGINTITIGDYGSLYCLKRYNMSEDVDYRSLIQ